MSNTFSSALSQCIKAMRDGELGRKYCLERYPEFEIRLSSLLDIAEQLMYLPYVSPDEKYRKLSRARILSTVSSRKFSLQSKRSFVGLSVLKAPALAVMLTILAVVFLGGRQVAFAANSSLPGDSIYSVKTAMEETQIYIADDAEDVILHLDFAQTRLDEVDRLAELKRYENIPVAVTGFEHHTQMAYTSLELVMQKDAEKGAEIAAIVEKQAEENVQALNVLVLALPEESQPTLQGALTVALELSGKSDAPIETFTIEPTAPVGISDPATPNVASDEDNPADTSDASTTSDTSDTAGNSGNAGKPDDVPGSNGNGNAGNSSGNAGGNENGNAGNSGNAGGSENGNAGNSGNAGGSENGNAGNSSGNAGGSENGNAGNSGNAGGSDNSGNGSDGDTGNGNDNDTGEGNENGNGGNNNGNGKDK